MDRMTTRIGLSIADDALHAVALKRGRIVWAATAPADPDSGLTDAIDSLLRLAPIPRFPRPLVSVAVGPHAAQLKVLTGLPLGQNSEALSAIVRESAGSFFLRNGIPLLTTNASQLEEGVALAAALEEPVVLAVREVCARRGCRSGFIAPTTVLLGRVLEQSEFTWADRSTSVEVTQSEGRIRSVRSRPVPVGTQAGSGILVPTLEALGPEAARYAGAYGAGMMEGRPQVALAPSGEEWSVAELKTRLKLPALVFLAGALVLALAPLAAIRAARQADARVAAVTQQQRTVMVNTLTQLEQASGVIEAVGGFARSRLLIAPDLAGIAAALSDGSLLVSLELEGERGEVVVLTADPTRVISNLEAQATITAVELVGSARREVVSGREVQRITLRWKRRQ